MVRRAVWGRHLIPLIMGLGIFWIANAEAANEQRCNELGANCICSEPLNASTYLEDVTAYFNPSDTTSLDKQCTRLDGFPGAVLEDGAGFNYQAASSGEMFTALPNRQASLTRLLRTSEGRGGMFIGHNYPASAPTARIAFRFYRYYSPGYQWTNEPLSCLNSSKLFEIGQGNAIFQGPILDGPSESHQLYVWGGYNLPANFDCCWEGPGPTSVRGTYGAGSFNGKWWRFEVVVRNALPTGGATVIEVYRKNVTNDTPEVKIIDTSMVTSQQVGDPWSSTQATTFKPRSRMSEYFINAFRNGSCAGYTGFTHLLAAAWNADTGQRIGAAIEVEGGVSALPAPGNLKVSMLMEEE